MIDPEPRTVDVLLLGASRYVRAMRCGHGQTAASQLLPGFEVALAQLFQPIES